jgi:F-type H+-transporting ATPase subunit delta
VRTCCPIRKSISANYNSAPVGLEVPKKSSPGQTLRTDPSAMFRQTLRQVARQTPGVARRAYASEAATSEALKLSLALPHETLYSESEVQQVNLPSINGDLGILANHIPIVEQLRPGLLEVISKSGETEQYFVSGGIATVQPGNKLTISAIEAFKPDQFDAAAVKSSIADAQKRAASLDEVVAAEATIELEVLEALQTFAK